MQILSIIIDVFVTFFVFYEWDNDLRGVHYQEWMDDMEDGCLQEVHLFLIMDPSEGIIPIIPLPLTKENNIGFFGLLSH